MQKVLVTGSEGFIGSAVSKYLRNLDFDVCGVDINMARPDKSNFQVDITSPNMNELIERIRPNFIIHIAAQIQVSESFINPRNDLIINAWGTLNLVQSALSNGVDNFCYINSGGAIYDQSGQLPVTESSLVKPLSPYGASKYLGEEYLRILSSENSMRWSSLALSNCYGPINIHKKGVIYSLATSITSDQAPEIYGSDVTRDFIYISDVTDAIACAMKIPSMSRVNISSGIETSLLELYKEISASLNFKKEAKISESRPGEIVRSCLSNEKARQLWGWSPKIDIKTGINLALHSKEWDS